MLVHYVSTVRTVLLSETHPWNVNLTRSEAYTVVDLQYRPCCQQTDDRLADHHRMMYLGVTLQLQTSR